MVLDEMNSGLYLVPYFLIVFSTQFSTSTFSFYFPIFSGISNELTVWVILTSLRRLSSVSMQTCLRERLMISVKGWLCVGEVNDCVMERIRQNLKIKICESIYLTMRKVRSFQENTMMNLEIQQEFSRILDIEGLNLSPQPPKSAFPSLKVLFQNKTSLNMIGKGANANIRSFYYLLLCHIRKVHLTQLLVEYQKKQADRLVKEEGQRDRRVSFNGIGTVFMKGPQYENYALHKLRIYAFSKNSDLQIIKNSPFQKDPCLKVKGKILTSLQRKKLLSQFLKELLPQQMPQNYKSQLKSIRYYLKKYKLVGVLLSTVMRHVLFSEYEISSAEDYEIEVNDHTVCTTLCDAFAIDGLICRENVYEINTWCKVHSLGLRGGRVMFVEMFNDQFQELGVHNDCKVEQIEVKKQEKQSKEQQQQQIQERLPSFNACFGQSSKNVQSSMKSSRGGSMMDSEVDSEIDSSEMSSVAIQTPAFNNAVPAQQFRETFSPNSGILEFMIGCEQSEELGKDGQQAGQIKEDFPKKKVNSTNKTFEESNCHSDEPTKKQFFHQQPSSFKKRQFKDDQDCTPADFFQKLSIPTQKQKLKIKSYAKDQLPVINNNISNNIYLSVGQHPPVINISTQQNDPQSININLS